MILYCNDEDFIWYIKNQLLTQILFFLIRQEQAFQMPTYALAKTRNL